MAAQRREMAAYRSGKRQIRLGSIDSGIFFRRSEKMDRGWEGRYREAATKSKKFDDLGTSTAERVISAVKDRLGK